VINFTLNGQGAKIFGDFTAKAVGKRMAVVLDNKVYSAPVIRERIGGGRVQISGNFKLEEAHDLAIALRSGALLAPVYVMEKRSVGPSLGADNIKASSLALVIINERIRELLHEGKSVAKSIEEGYDKAFTAILDANVTTLIAAVVLWAYGTGPLKGFALTMGIGILASMLTAIVGTHGIYQWLLPKIDKKKLGFWFGIKTEGKK